MLDRQEPERKLPERLEGKWQGGKAGVAPHECVRRRLSRLRVYAGFFPGWSLQCRWRGRPCCRLPSGRCVLRQSAGASRDFTERPPSSPTLPSLVASRGSAAASATTCAGGGGSAGVPIPASSSEDLYGPLVGWFLRPSADPSYTTPLDATPWLISASSPFILGQVGTGPRRCVSALAVVRSGATSDEASGVPSHPHPTIRDTSGHGRTRAGTLRHQRNMLLTRVFS